MNNKFGYYNIICGYKQLYKSEKSHLVQWGNSTTQLAMCKCSKPKACVCQLFSTAVKHHSLSLTFCYIYNNPYIILDKRLMELRRDINLPYFPVSNISKTQSFFPAFIYPYGHGRTHASYVLAT